MISLRQWIDKSVSFKYISNFSIIICILAYYMNAIDIVFVLAPIIIVNLIFILVLEYIDLDKIIYNVFRNNNLTRNELKDIRLPFLILNTLWHLLPVIWLYYIYTTYNLIYIYKPNFMGIFLQGCIICIIYFYFCSKNLVYGDINYSMYSILYFITLLSICSYLYIYTI